MTPPPLKTINDLFCRVSAAQNPRAILWQDQFGNWQPLSSDQIYHRVHSLSEAFLSWGAKKGDRIALIGENRWEWVVTDFAILAINAVNVPIYPTLTGEQIAVLLADAGCRIAVVSTRQQFDKLNAVRSQTQLERILMMDGNAPEGAIAFSKILAGADDAGTYRDPVFDALVRSVEPADLATLIYTSGTTGEPKGVMLTHGNIAANQNVAASNFSFGETDACISFLPLSHITARALDYVMFNYGAQVAYCSQLRQASSVDEGSPPHSLCWCSAGVREDSPGSRTESLRTHRSRSVLLAWALGVGAGHRDTVYAGKQPSAFFWKIANKLVYSKVREAFGGRVRILVSGGAPLGIDTAKWFAAAGIAVWEGYGLTETSPVIALNNPLVHRMGAVGKPIGNIDVKFAEDGELLVRGPSIFVGYWKKPAADMESFDAEGWFRTGDIGHLDADGFLYITDRKKELLKTSGGKLVAPQPIENKLKNSVMVAQVALVGDKHKFICALISPNFAALEEWAKQAGLEAPDRKALVADSRVVALYGEVVREANAGLANFETIKRFRLVADEWSQDSGELTPSMKLKRRVISAKYASVIDELYADEATARAV